MAAAAAHAVCKEILSNDLVSKVKTSGEVFQSQLQTLMQDHPHVGDIRGRGFFRGVEIVQDKIAKAPFKRECQIAPRLKKIAFDLGLVCYPMPGTRDGKSGDHVLLAPPFIATEDQLQWVAETLLTAIDEACNTAAAAARNN